jgi:Domain of unknown function (DUF4123)
MSAPEYQSSSDTILPASETREVHNLVVQELRSLKEPLYIILDAARDPLILARLVHCKEEHQSLYEGAKGNQLAAAAPHLVSVPRESAFLESIVRDLWGKSWGVFLTCDQSFKEVRKHLRRFLMVELEPGKTLYFRFYDPRVLRVFLPTCTQDELTQFFGPATTYVMEAKVPDTLLRFRRQPRELRQETILLRGLEAYSSVAVPQQAKG